MIAIVLLPQIVLPLALLLWLAPPRTTSMAPPTRILIDEEEED